MKLVCRWYLRANSTLRSNRHVTALVFAHNTRQTSHAAWQRNWCLHAIVVSCELHALTLSMTIVGEIKLLTQSWTHACVLSTMRGRLCVRSQSVSPPSYALLWIASQWRAMVRNTWRPGLTYFMLARYRGDTILLLLSACFLGPLIASLVELNNSLTWRCWTQHTLNLDRLPPIHRLEVFLLLSGWFHHVR